MNFFQNITVRKKLFVSFTILAMLIAISGFIGIVNSSKINKNAESMFTNSLVGIRCLENIKNNIEYERGSVINLMCDQTITSDEKK